MIARSTGTDSQSVRRSYGMVLDAGAVLVVLLPRWAMLLAYSAAMSPERSVGDQPPAS